VVTLVIEDPQTHQRKNVPLPGPGGQVRIAVGRPGHRSGAWRLWANRNKSDVYVAARPIAGVQKLSLHESGDWRHQWVNPERAEEFTGSRDRILAIWRRPEEGPGGWIRGVSIWVPQPDIVDIPHDDQPHEGVVWLPEPPPGYVIGIHIVIAKPDQGVVQVTGAVPVEGFTMANGMIVLVLASRIELTEERRHWLDEQRERAQAVVGHIDLTKASAPRMTLFGYENTGNRVLWDLAVR
jgi:hypothetical protein